MKSASVSREGEYIKDVGKGQKGKRQEEQGQCQEKLQIQNGNLWTMDDFFTMSSEQ